MPFCLVLVLYYFGDDAFGVYGKKISGEGRLQVPVHDNAQKISVREGCRGGFPYYFAIAHPIITPARKPA